MAVIPSPVAAGNTLLVGVDVTTTGANTISVLGDIADGANPASTGNGTGYGLLLSSPASSWGVTVEGGVGSIGSVANGMEDGIGIHFANLDSIIASTLLVKAEAGVSGTQFGVFSQAILNITNNGSIGGEEAGINYNGDTNGGDPGQGKLNDIIAGVARGIAVTNNAGATIEGTLNGINNYSNAMLTVTNTGLISSNIFSAINSDGGLKLTNNLGGIIDGNVEFGWTGNSVTNSGKIFGTVTNYFDGGLLDWSDNATPLLATDDYVGLDLDRDGDFSDVASKGVVKFSTVELTTAKNIITNKLGGIIEGQSDYGTDNNSGAEFQVALDLNDYTADAITNDGTIYGEIWTDSGKDSLTNNLTGIIYGHVSLGHGEAGPDDHDTFTNLGKIYGNSDSLGNVHNGVNLGTGNNTATNSGFIDGSIHADNGNDKVTNTGTIQGEVALGDGNNELVSNTILIDGPVWAGFGNDKITSTGIIAGDVGIGWSTEQLNDFVASLDPGEVANFALISQDRDTVTNGGHIFGHVFTGTGDDVIINNGTIHDGLNAENGDNKITNNKIIFNGIRTGDADNTKLTATTFEVENILNAATGQVFDGIRTGSGDRTITNNGSIFGHVRTGRVLTFDDPIDDENDIVESIGQGADTLINTKDILGRVELAAGNNKLVNSGFIDGSVQTLEGNDMIEHNAGTIMGGIDVGDGTNTVTVKSTLFGQEYYNVEEQDYRYFSVHAGDGFDTLKNLAGTLYGDVNLGDGGSSVENTGTIYGRLYAGAGTDTVTNSKLIDAQVFLGAGPNDKFENKTGAVVNGSIYLARHLNNIGGETLEDGKNTLINAGTIEGMVEGGDGVDIITNSKLIRGDVRLHGDDATPGTSTVNGVLNVANGDVLDNRTGIIEGRIYMGAGTDTVMGGAGREVVIEVFTTYDENDNPTGTNTESALGADKYELGSGDDYLVAFNDEDVDLYDGGLGARDAIDFVHLNGGITLNLNLATANLTFDQSTFVDTVKGFEEVFGSTFGDTIVGNDAGTGVAEFLHGEAGADTFTGGKGADQMWAGSAEFGGPDGDVDMFVYNAVTDSLATRVGRDTIYEFDTAMDLIDLTALDADTRIPTATNGAAGNQDFTWLGVNASFSGGAALGTAGELRAVIRGTQTIIEGDTNGDRKADFSIALDGVHLGLTDANFLGLDLGA